jgi:hypothetical protein
MDRPIGSNAKLNGKDVVWSGSEYGWQSPASHLKLRNQGHFAIGRKELDAVGRFLAPGIQKIKDFQQKFSQATPWLDPVENAVNRTVKADDKLPSSRVAQGGAVAAQRVTNALNIDPRVGMALPFLVGAVHTSGPRAGTVKLKPRRDISIPHNQLYNRGNVDFETRNGLTLKIKPPTNGQVAKAAAEGKPKPQPIVTPLQIKPEVPTQVSPPTSNFNPTKPQNPLQEGSPPWALSPQLEATRGRLTIRGLPDPNKRFRPEKSLQKVDRTTKERFMTPIDSTGKPNSNIDDFYSKKGAYGVSKGDKTFKLNGQVVETKGAISRQAEVNQIPGYEDVKIDWHEAHHIRPLKDAFDFVNSFDDPAVALRAIDSTGTPRGSTVLNRIDLPQRFHTGKDSAHSRLRNEQPGVPEAGFPLEAQSGTNRWQFLQGLSDEDKLQYLPYLMADADQNVKVALQQAFKENLIPPSGSHNPYRDRYIGNFAQQVLMPPSKEAREWNRQRLHIRRQEAGK